MKNERAFKGVWITKEIWLDKNLTWMEKLFLVEINSLDNDDGCFASNKYFGGFFNSSEKSASNIINSIKKKGYIEILLEKKGNNVTKRVIRVNKNIFVSSPLNVENQSINNGVVSPLNVEYNNKEFNNTINNIYNTITLCINEGNNIALEEAIEKDIGVSVMDLTIIFRNYEIKKERNQKEIIKYLLNDIKPEVIENGLSIPFNRNVNDFDIKNDKAPIENPVAYGMSILENWYKFGVKTIDDVKKYNKLLQSKRLR